MEIFSRIKVLSVSELSVEISKNIDAPTFVIFLLLYFYKFEHFLHSYLEEAIKWSTNYVSGLLQVSPGAFTTILTNGR